LKVKVPGCILLALPATSSPARGGIDGWRSPSDRPAVVHGL
jgi:hypothetical protein